MKQAMVMCVGSRDPYWDPQTKRYCPEEPGRCTEVGPVLDFLERFGQEPEEIYLISTRDGPRVRNPTWQGGEETAGQIRERWPRAVVHHWGLEGSLDPNDYLDMLRGLGRVTGQIMSACGPEADLHVNLSPGTPQMQGAWISLVYDGALRAQLFQLKEGGEIRWLEVDPLFEGELARQGGEFCQQFAFQAAASVLRRLSERSLHLSRRERAAWLADLLQSYHCWSLFDYPGALQGLKSLACWPGPLEEMGLRGLGEQIELLESYLTRSGPNLPKMLDLYHSAQRQYAIKSYIECLWRCGAVVEQAEAWLAAREVRDRTGIVPNVYRFQASLEPHLKKEPVRRFLQEAYQGNIREVPPFLGVGEASRLLRKLRSPYLSLLPSDTLELVTKRGNVLHRIEPTTPEEAREGLRIAEETLRSLLSNLGSDLGGKEILECYPFSFGVLRSLGEAIPSLLVFLEREVPCS